MTTWHVYTCKQHVTLPLVRVQHVTLTLVRVQHVTLTLVRVQHVAVVHLRLREVGDVDAGFGGEGQGPVGGVGDDVDELPGARVEVDAVQVLSGDGCRRARPHVHAAVDVDTGRLVVGGDDDDPHGVRVALFAECRRLDEDRELVGDSVTAVVHVVHDALTQLVLRELQHGRQVAPRVFHPPVPRPAHHEVVERAAVEVLVRHLDDVTGQQLPLALDDRELADGERDDAGHDLDDKLEVVERQHAVGDVEREDVGVATSLLVAVLQPAAVDVVLREPPQRVATVRPAAAQRQRAVLRR